MLNLNKKISAKKTLLPLALLIGLIPTGWAAYYSLQSFTLSCMNIGPITSPSNTTAAAIAVAGYVPLLISCSLIYARPPKVKAAIFVASSHVIMSLIVAFATALYAISTSHFSLSCSNWTF